MPLYDYVCAQCGKTEERYLPMMGGPAPPCCGKPMVRRVGGGGFTKWHHPLWVDRIDEIHKRQSDRGERLRIVQPWEVRAT